MAGGDPQSGSPPSGPSASGGGQSNGNVMALLSLNILLLAFFILLNSMASFEEERRDAVMDSVREAFQGTLPAVRNLRSDPSAVDIFDGAEEIIDSLTQLFGPNLPLMESQKDAGTWALKVDLPVGDVFSEDGDDLRPDGAETLRLIAGVLTDPRFRGADYRVDVLYGLPGRVSGIDGNRQAMRRAGRLVRELVDQRMDPATLSAGLLPEFAGKLRFQFTIQLHTPPPAQGGAEG